MLQVSDLEKMVSKANGRRRTRTIGKTEMQEFCELVNNATDEQHTIRVYSRQGFVPNSYKYRADISCLEANRDKETGKMIVGAFAVGAKRSHGNGALVTINGRAAE